MFHPLSSLMATTYTSKIRLLSSLQSFRSLALNSKCPPPSTRSFSTSTPLLKKQQQRKGDPRVALIRYHMQHPLMPRPLKLSRMRALRHWTIDRAWNVFEAQRRKKEELELQRQYQSMQSAMEELRLLDDGSGASKEGSRLYRIALEKKGIFGHGAVPIEYARLQTETPALVPWDHDWKR